MQNSTKAEKIFRSKNNQGYAELRENITAVEAKKQENAETASSVELSQNQIKVILEQNTQFLVKTIREFKDKIQVLEKEVFAKFEGKFTKIDMKKALFQLEKEATRQRIYQLPK